MLLSASSSPRPLVSHYLMPFGLSICRHGCLLTGYLFHPTLQYFLRLCDRDNSSIFRLDAASCSPVICCNLSCIRWGLSVLAARVLRTIFSLDGTHIGPPCPACSMPTVLLPMCASSSSQVFVCHPILFFCSGCAWQHVSFLQPSWQYGCDRGFSQHCLLNLRQA